MAIAHYQTQTMKPSSKDETVHRAALTKHNRPVGTIRPSESEVVELWGAMRGTVTVLPGTDLTAPTGETWKAES